MGTSVIEPCSVLGQVLCPSLVDNGDDLVCEGFGSMLHLFMMCYAWSCVYVRVRACSYACACLSFSVTSIMFHPQLHSNTCEWLPVTLVHPDTRSLFIVHLLTSFLLQDAIQFAGVTSDGNLAWAVVKRSQLHLYDMVSSMRIALWELPFHSTAPHRKNVSDKHAHATPHGRSLLPTCLRIMPFDPRVNISARVEGTHA